MKGINKNVKNWIIIIIVLTSFLLWYLTNDYFKRFVSLSITKQNTEIENVNKDMDLSLIWEVYNKIQKEYFSIDGIKNEDLVSWMAKWLVESLWDKHSEYMSKSEKQSFEETLSWDFEWIWAVVEKNDLWVSVSMVIKDSPAKNSWILVWDVITLADWVDLKDKNVYDAVKLIKWKAWTNVKLTIKRVWEPNVFVKEITRQKIVIPSVQSKVLEWTNYWYIALNLFWDNTFEEFKSSLNEMKSKKVDWLIIDLRDNWGWYLQSAVEILSEFVENWKILVKTNYRNEIMDYAYRSTNEWELFDKKIVVLVNWNSASASEITSGALREYNKAILVWEKTFWKWSVQEPFDLSDWGLLKLTIAKWFTPNGLNIDKDWIKPDVEVLFTKDDYEKHYDRQLEEAKKVLKDFIKYDALQLSVDKYKEENKE